MKFDRLLEIVGDEPVFETGLLLAGAVDAADVRRQLSRWVRAGRLIHLRRGLYALAPPYAKARPHAFLVANCLTRGSYVSCQSALGYHGIVPETVPVVTSVAAARPGRRLTALGVFELRHLDSALLFGYRSVDVGGGRLALVATPEKALLDLAHLTAGGDDPAFLAGLRLQNLDRLDLGETERMARRFGRPKLLRVARGIAALGGREAEEYETL